MVIIHTFILRQQVHAWINILMLCFSLAGPLAGPVVAVACIIRPEVFIGGVMDSKQTKESDREATYLELSSHPGVRWSACRVEPAEIDEVNILQASLNAMRRATESVLELIVKDEGNINASEYVALIDGNHAPKDMPVMCKTVIKVIYVDYNH